MAKRKHDSGGSVLLSRGDPMRCRYQSGNCPYPRVLKLTGEPHRLCKEHREKANASQRKLTKKQKHENAKRQEGELPAHAASDVEATAIMTGRAGDRKCAYSNGRCGAERAVKTNGCYHRFCETHRLQAKKDQHNHVKKHQKHNQARSPWVDGELANLSSSEFQLISTSQPQAVDAVLTAYGRGDLAIQGGEKWPFNDCNIDDLTEFPFDDFDLLDNVPFNEPMQVLVNDVKYDDAELLLAHGAPWLLEYIDEIYASLKMEEP